MSSFRKFIQSLLKRAKINAEHRASFTDEDGMKLFQAAFTHATFDPNNNYEIWEFIGDGILKGILSQYIPRRFPELATGEGVLSKARRSLESDKTLAQLGINLGFWEHVQAGEEILQRNRNKTVEDVFEAFIGVLTEIVDRRVKRGLGYIYAYNFVQSVLDERELVFSKETLDDPITRLNELYKSKELQGGLRPLKWGDAVYVDRRLPLPLVQELPRDPRIQIGDMVIQNTTVFVYTRNGWTHVSKVPLMELRPLDYNILPGFENLDEEELAEKIKSVWYAAVLGFTTKVWPSDEQYWQEVKDRARYGTIIGHGIAFKKQDAKKTAATAALKVVHGMGFRK